MLLNNVNETAEFEKDHFFFSMEISLDLVLNIFSPEAILWALYLKLLGWRSKAGSELNGSFKRICCFEFSPCAVLRLFLLP